MKINKCLIFFAVMACILLQAFYSVPAHARGSVYRIDKTVSDRFKYKDVFTNKPDLIKEEKTKKGKKKKNAASKEENEEGTIVRTFSYLNFDKKYIAVYFSIDSKDYKKAIATHGKARKDLIYDPLSNTNRHNLPRIARQEAPYVKRIQKSMARAIFMNDYRSDREITATILAFVQNAIPYKIPPEDHLSGLLLPVEALVEKYGDCDTKSLLMAALLSYWKHIKIIVIHLEKHCFLGAAIPVVPGDDVFEYNGKKYVLMEPAGKNWKLGKISDYSKEEMSKWYAADAF